MKSVISSVGRVVRDAEVRQVGSSYLGEFAIVNDRAINKGTDENGKTIWENIPTFLEVKAWGKLGESSARFKKGDIVQVGGLLESERWVDKESGEKRSKMYINANSIDMIVQKNKEKDTESAPVESTPTPVSDEVPF